jgi:hypothetical protein
MCHAARLSRSGTYPVEPRGASVFSRYASFPPINNQMRSRGTEAASPDPYTHVLPRHGRSRAVPPATRRLAPRCAVKLPPRLARPAARALRRPFSRARLRFKRLRSLAPSSRSDAASPAPCTSSGTPAPGIHRVVGERMPARLGVFFPPLCTTASDLRFCGDDRCDDDVWTGIGGAMWSTVERGGAG